MLNDIDHTASPLIEHVRELRRRLVIIFATLFVGFALSYGFAGHIYQFLLAPLAEIFEGQTGRRLIYTGLAEAFFVHLKVALFAGFILTFPIIAGQLYFFLAPGLYKKEKKVVLPFLIAAPILFLLGAAMVYYFIFPLAWQFFLGFEVPSGDGNLPIQLEARTSEYLSIVMKLIIAFGLAFQLPIILMLLARAGFVTTQALKQKWKYALVGVVVLAAILTPPDIISQIGLAIPLMFLYGCSILLCRWVEKEKQSNA